MNSLRIGSGGFLVVRNVPFRIWSPVEVRPEWNRRYANWPEPRCYVGKVARPCTAQEWLVKSALVLTMVEVIWYIYSSFLCHQFLLSVHSPTWAPVFKLPQTHTHITYLNTERWGMPGWSVPESKDGAFQWVFMARSNAWVFINDWDPFFSIFPFLQWLSLCKISFHSSRYASWSYRY